MKTVFMFLIMCLGVIGWIDVVLADSVKVLEVQGSAWASAEPSGVKRSLAPGDVLRKHDLIEVALGGSLRLQQGQGELNHILIQGPSKVRIQALFGNYYVEKGRLIARLDALLPGQNFTVETACAIASVRGTQFWVDYTGGVMETAVYSGVVHVSMKKDDISSDESFWVNGGQKLLITAAFEVSTQMLNSTEKEIFIRTWDLFRQPTATTSMAPSVISESTKADDVYESAEDDIVVSGELSW